MKKLLTLLLLALSVQLFAQSYPITSITISLPANPDANTVNWGSGTSLFMISATAKGVNGRVDIMVESSKILVTIKKGGGKICGIYTSGSAPSASFNALTKVWRGSSALSLLGQDCTLPPGDYELSVQFFGNGPTGLMALSEEKTKGFTIRGMEQQAYQAPQALMPTNGIAFKEADLQKPISFRWTPIVPKPQEPTTYRLKVWQLMQGQNGSQAMRANQPIITKDVENLTQATANNIITGPCKPPYLCSFVWNVQALNKEGKAIGGNNGTSELMAFSGSATETAIALPTLKQPANGETIATGKQQVFSWQAALPTPTGTTTYKIKIVEIKGDQSPENAFRTNKPIFEKDSIEWLGGTNKPHFERDTFEFRPFTNPNILPKFVEGEKYAWAVAILDKSGNQKWSDISIFSITNCNVNLKLQLQSIECLKTVNGLSTYKVCVAATYTSPNYNLTYTNASSSFKAYAPSYSPTYSITNLSPSLQVQNSGGASTVNYCFEVTVPVGQTAIKIGLQGDDKGPGPITCQPGAELEINRLPNCPPPCDCGTWGKLKVENSPIIGFECGKLIDWKCNQKFSFSNDYNCNPISATCVAKTEWVIKKDGQPYTNGTGLNGSFTPTANGVYTITLKATCNGKECPPCEYRVVVKDCPPPCACGTWGDLVVQNAAGIIRVACGKELMWKCGQDFKFSNSFTCLPNDASCVAKTVWSVTKDGQSYANGSGLNGNFTPTANGTYTITLKATCNGKECPPCEYRVVVKDCPPPCACGTWGDLVVQNAAGIIRVACGKELMWKCGQDFKFSNSFTCLPNDASCVAKTEWSVTKDGQPYANGSGLNGNFTPTANGTYTITLKATCNGKECPPCEYRVVVKDCPPPCACGTWGDLVVQNAAGIIRVACGKELMWKCGQKFNFSNSFACLPNGASCVAETKWTISKNNMIIGFGNGTAGSFVFTANGTYTITLQAKCNGKECPPCTYTILINDCPPPCECGIWGKFVVTDCKNEEKVACDDKITKSCNSTITFANTFSCGNTSPTCIAKTDWKVEKNGTTISSGSGLVGALTFTSNGIYTITLNAECNGKKCKPCSFTVVVTDCK